MPNATTAIASVTEPPASTTTLTVNNTSVTTPAVREPTSSAATMQPLGQTPLQQLLNEVEEDARSTVSERLDDVNNLQGPRPEVNAWSRKFNAHQRAIDRMAMFVQSERIANIGVEMIKNRKEELEKEWNMAHEIFYSLIGEVEEGQAQHYDDCMEHLEDTYYETHAVLSSKIVALEEKILSESRAASEIGQGTRPIKLIMPVQQHNMQNTWGKFDGGLRKWIGFRDRFKAAIHGNSDITDAYKLQYLLQSLAGTAAQALGKSDNYEQAWERLLELYDKPYLIAQEHLRDFYNLPTLQTPASA